jgi:hypothetical protein
LFKELRAATVDDSIDGEEAEYSGDKCFGRSEIGDCDGKEAVERNWSTEAELKVSRFPEGEN